MPECIHDKQFGCCDICAIEAQSKQIEALRDTLDERLRDILEVLREINQNTPSNR